MVLTILYHVDRSKIGRENLPQNMKLLYMKILLDIVNCYNYERTILENSYNKTTQEIILTRGTQDDIDKLLTEGAEGLGRQRG